MDESSMLNNSRLAALLLVAVLLGACTVLQPTPGVTYLPEGDVETGKAAFVDLKCHQCHSVSGKQIQPPEADKASVYLDLGGKIHRINSFSELVRAVVSPNHIISGKYLQQLDDISKTGEIESPMPDFIDKMTVKQLIDLMAFLNKHYEELTPHYRGYDYGYRIF